MKTSVVRVSVYKLINVACMSLNITVNILLIYTHTLTHLEFECACVFKRVDTVGLTGIKLELLSLNQLSSLHQTVCVCLPVCLITVPVFPPPGREKSA